jgi:hypothetical protein
MIRTSQGLGQLKRGRSKFCVYLEQQRVYTNKDQLGEENSITLGWKLKAHPSFCYRDDTKEALHKMMGDKSKEAQYALFPKTIKYKRIKDEAKMTTNGIKLQVTKTPGITVADFRSDMVKSGKKLQQRTEGLSLG